MQLPILSSLTALVTQWKAILDPLLAKPISDVQILPNVSINNGVTTIDHKLNRLMQGWFIVDINAPATIYRSQPLNDKTLTLTSSGACIVNIGVF